MKVGELYDFFRNIVDEDDDTFLTEAQAAEMLKEAYREFRDLVVSVDPDVYKTEAFITLTASDVFDLIAGGVLGNAANPNPANPMHRLIRIARIDSQASNRVVQYLDPVSLVTQLIGDDYARAGDKIYFGYQLSETLRMEYVEFADIDFKKSTNNLGYIDNLAQFHTLIALMAAKYYEIRDGSFNEVLERRRLEKAKELKTWLTRFWKGGISSHVTRITEA